jgi:hypothetical protein
MLASIGEAPIDTLDSATQQMYRQQSASFATRLVKFSQGWRFNTEFGFQVAPEVRSTTWTQPVSPHETRRVSSTRRSRCVRDDAARRTSRAVDVPDAVIRPARSSYTGPAERTITARPTFLAPASAQSSRAPSRRVSPSRSQSRSTFLLSPSPSPATTPRSRRTAWRCTTRTTTCSAA